MCKPLSCFHLFRVCCLLIGGTLFGLQLSAQPRLKFTSLTTKDGLSSNTINEILKDDQGFLWIATTDGLNKFDGTNVSIFRHEAENKFSLPSNEITALYKDHNGRIWIGTANGICYYDPQLDRFKKCNSADPNAAANHMAVRAIFEDQSGLLWFGGYSTLITLDPHNMKFSEMPLAKIKQRSRGFVVFLSFFEEKEGTIWMGTNKGLLIYNKRKDSYLHFRHNPGDPNSISNNVVKKIVRDEQGDIWLATFKGLNRISRDRNSFVAFQNSETDDNGTELIHCILKTNDAGFWLGTENGLNVFDVKTSRMQTVNTDQQGRFGLPNKIIRAIFSDEDGIVWLGTAQGGVYKYDPHLPLFSLEEYHNSISGGLSAPVVTAFVQDPRGTIYIGTARGIQTFNPANQEYKTIKLQISGVSGKPVEVKSLEIDKDGALWVGTIREGVLKVNPSSGNCRQYLFHGLDKNIEDNDIYCLMRDSNGRIWAGTNGDGVYSYDGSTNKFSKLLEPLIRNNRPMPTNGYMRALAQKTNGEIWMGTMGAGITIYNIRSKVVRLLNAENSNLSSNGVLSILHDQAGNTWVGTQGGGLNLYNVNTRKFIAYTEKDGLASNIVGKILEDKLGRIWLSTARGISCFDLKRKTFKNYSAYNGVQAGSMMGGAGLCASNGFLFFGGYEGFNFFDPKTLPEDAYAHPIRLTELKVANMTVLPGKNSAIKEQISKAKEINLSHGQNFSLSFVAVNFTNPNQTRYSYQLVGFDKDWINIGRSRTAYYTNIDPGEYIFKVKASDNLGAWTAEESAIKIIIHPPFWRTFYAYIFYIIALSALLFWIRRRGIRKIEQKFQIEQERLKNKQLLEHERQQAEQLHELDEEKIKFLTNLTHELRTPVSLIMATLDKLYEVSTSDEVSNQVVVVRRNARRLLNFVNQLLDFKKVEEHKLKMDSVLGDIVAFVKEAAESFQDIAERKGISFRIEVTTTGIHTSYDADKLERIIFNLLSNAFKFTPRGGNITLTLSLLMYDDLPTLSIVVADTGPGIPVAEQERVFERFYQSETGDAILNQGSGIGLSITKEYVEFLGGSISIESAEQGTRFNVLLPVAAYDKLEDKLEVIDAPAPEDSVYNTDDFTNKTVLVVEDNDDYRSYLTDELARHYHIVDAVDGADGWQKILSQHPDIVIADVNMPKMSGVELSRKIKADKRTNQLPVILLTAISGDQAQIAGLKSGANDYVTKPCNLQILNEKIRNLLMLNQISKDTYKKQFVYERPDIVFESADEMLLKQIIVFIENNMVDPDLSVLQLSKEVGMSRTTLYHKIISLTGLTPIEYIRKIRLDRAALMLLKSGKNIAQVAFLTGFASPSYFSRKFKDHFNMLPSDYIEQERLKAP